MRQAIQTKYHGPTDHKGSRVWASCIAGRMLHHWDHSLNNEQNHRMAAEKLIKRLSWGRLNKACYCGVLKNGDHVFVMEE